FRSEQERVQLGVGATVTTINQLDLSIVVEGDDGLVAAVVVRVAVRSPLDLDDLVSDHRFGQLVTVSGHGVVVGLYAVLTHLLPSLASGQSRYRPVSSGFSSRCSSFNLRRRNAAHPSPWG